jgi:DNA-nicking Smr family endonuclease
MRGVRPLGGPRSALPDPRDAPAPLPARKRDRPSAPGGLTPLDEASGLGTVAPDVHAFVAAGVSRARVRELRTGRGPVEATLDLHGERAAPAQQRLRAFVRTARGQGRRLLLVIHGRGHGSGPAGPVLRDLVIEALTRGPLAAEVLAVVSAPPARGGAGATLIWLRG